MLSEMAYIRYGINLNILKAHDARKVTKHLELIKYFKLLSSVVQSTGCQPARGRRLPDFRFRRFFRAPEPVVLRHPLEIRDRLHRIST